MAKIKIYNLKEMVKANTGFQIPELFFGHNLTQVEGTPVYVYTEPVDTFLHSRNILLSACVKLQFGDEIYDTVVVDSNFKKLPDEVQAALIHHEVGHAINKDLDGLSANESRKIILKRLLGFPVEMELKADAYAASVLGYKSVIKALQFMVKETNIPFLSGLEIRRRIKVLKKSARP